MNHPFDEVITMTLDKRIAEGTGTAGSRFRDIKPLLSTSWKTFLMGEGSLCPGHFYDHIDVPASPRKQAYNYAVCLRKAISYAKQGGAKRILYLEDDAVPTWDFEKVFPVAWKELNESVALWDLVYIGGKQLNAPTWPISPHVVRSFYNLDMHCLAVNETAYDKLLNIMPSSESTIDGIIAEKTKRGEFLAYAFRPCLATQRAGFSYNEGRHTNRSEDYLVSEWPR